MALPAFDLRKHLTVGRLRYSSNFRGNVGVSTTVSVRDSRGHVTVRGYGLQCVVVQTSAENSVVLAGMILRVLELMHFNIVLVICMYYWGDVVREILLGARLLYRQHEKYLTPMRILMFL